VSRHAAFGSSHIYGVILRNTVCLRLLNVVPLGRYWYTHDGMYPWVAMKGE
jgi:hypothetical protein